MVTTTSKILLLLLGLTSCAYAQQYGVRMRWTSNAQSCTNPPDAIEYWPIGSPFAEQGSGTCIDIPLADGGHAYYTYSTSDSIPSVPSSWSPFYAVETFWENTTGCEEAQPDAAASVIITNSDSCIFMGASTTGYHYLRLDCTSESAGLVYSCRDSACTTDCRPTWDFQGGCDDYVNSIHSCAANPSSSTPTTPAPTQEGYGLRMRWVSNANGCTDEPDAIDYWPIGSPFAEEGSGECVDVNLADGGHAYFTYTTSPSIPSVPSSWSPFYAVATFYDNSSACAVADPSTVESVTITNSDSCIFMGASTTGYHYLRLDCTSESAGLVYSCRDSACTTDCRPTWDYQGGCDDYVNSVHSCAANPSTPGN